MGDFPALEQFTEALEVWTDERFMRKEDLQTVSIFAVYLVNLLEAAGATYDGHSLTVKSPMCLLVVRGKLDEIPHVVFTSGRTPIACMRIFLRKLEEDLLEWQPDRFR